MPELKAMNLAIEPPRSPFVRLGNLSILARTIDKCRATVAETAGAYHYNCPLDKMVLSFTDINADDFKEIVSEGRTDEEILAWVKEHGISRTDEEIALWSDTVDATMYSTDPEKKEWFAGECARLGLNPETTSLFQYLDVDDKKSFSNPTV